VRVLVLGGGAWGCATGYSLAAAGAEVTILERGALASGATSRAAGVVSPLLWSREDVALAARSYTWFDETCCRGDSTLHHPGELKLVRTESEARRLREHVEGWRRLGVAVELLEADALRSRSPSLALDAFAAGAYVARAGFADPYQMTAALVRQGRDKGLVLRQGLAVTRLRTRRGEVTAVETEAGPATADAYVLAAGTWSTRLAATAGLPLPLRPYRTQALSTTAIPPQGIPVVHDSSSGTYFFQEEGGGILGGDGTQETESDPDAFNAEADFDFVSAFTATLQQLLPAAGGARFVRGWAGLCGATPDREPLLGYHRECANLFVACGDNGFGFMRSPALGECAAAMVLGGEPPIDLRAFDVNRFRGTEAFAIRQGYTL
jgi:glycine/D-amino acid oxidase-like deaminating enzyme